MTVDIEGQTDPLLTPSDEENRRSQDEFIGERVHVVMWRMKVSQTDTAPVVGLTQSALSNKLKGKRPFFAREIGALAAYLKVNPAYLYGFTDDPRPADDDRASGKLSRLGESNPRPFHYKSLGRSFGLSLTAAQRLSA